MLSKDPVTAGSLFFNGLVYYVVQMKEFSPIISLLENARYYYIICVDVEGKYTYINKAYAERFKHIDSHFKGKFSAITMHPEDLPRVQEAGLKCMTDKTQLVPVTIRKHDGAGGYVFTQWEFKGIFNEEGVPEGVFCLGYDITEFIEELSRKNDLIDDVAFRQSHILRRPVANIIGVVNILKDIQLPADTKIMLDMLYKDIEELDIIVRKLAQDIRS